MVQDKKYTKKEANSRRRQPSARQGPKQVKRHPATGRPVPADRKKRAPVAHRPIGAKIPPVTPDVVRIIPLGGVEEVGKNMTVIECGNDIIVIDAGLQFRSEETPGIDYIIPNTKYLQQRKEHIRGLFITHGHLDHIGAIPYVIDKIGNPPIYSREFGAALIQKRQVEFPHLPKLKLNIIEGEETIQAGKNFSVKTFPISHTIPDSMGLLIDTPLGEIAFIEDVRVDNIDGKPIEEERERYKRFKGKKILLLTLDSTSVELPGFSLSEQTVVKNLEKFIREAPARLIIGTFASQVERIINVVKLAQKYNKKVVVEGRSMKINFEIIKQLKLLENIENVIPIEDMDDYPPNKIVVLATGAQGEEFAALMRISNKTHRYIRLNKTDIVLLSASVIPGNEYAIQKLKDSLYRTEARVFTYHDSDIHSSGHGNRGELQWIHNQIDYRFFIPFHGHHYMLRQHSYLSQETKKTPPSNVMIPDNGSIIEIYDGGKKMRMLREKAPAELSMVDGFSIGDVQHVVIRDRQMLAQDGIFVVIAVIDLRNGKIRKSPDIIARGFVYVRESQELLQETRRIIKDTVEGAARGRPINFEFIKGLLTDNISRFLFRETAKRPLVIPVIISV